MGQRMYTPLIMGSVVKDKFVGQLNCHNSINNMTFNRRLRMIRADLYTLLSISINSDFFQNPKESQIVKMAICKFLEGESQDRAERYQLFENLSGWNKLLHEKCYKNQIVEVQSINEPQCVKEADAPQEEPGNQHYVFASILEPGYHQILIYDPLTNRAFCKDFVVELNHHQILFPEMPKVIDNAEKFMKKLPPVFHKWKRDTPLMQEEAMTVATSPYTDDGVNYREDFQPQRYLKDPEDVEKCEAILRDYFNIIQTCFLDCLSRSKKYPEVDLKCLNDFVFDMQNIFNQLTAGNLQFDAAQIQIAFMSSTRNDERTNRAMNRGEFLDILMRLAHIVFRKQAESQFMNPTIQLKRKDSQSSRGRNTNRRNRSYTSLSIKDQSPEQSDSSPEYKEKEKIDSTSSKGAVAGTMSPPKSALSIQSKQNTFETHSPEQSAKPQKEQLQATSTAIITPFKQGSAEQMIDSSQIQQPRSGLPGLTQKKKGEVHKHLKVLFDFGWKPFHQGSIITRLRKEIQDDPQVVTALAERLKELKVIFNKFCNRNRQFRYESSVLKMFEMADMVEYQRLKLSTLENHYWDPLTPEDLWDPFVHCQMTIINEHKDTEKYNHIVFVEFCEYIARVAFTFYDLRYYEYEEEKLELENEDDGLTKEEKRNQIPPPDFKGERHIQVSRFLERLITRHIK